jgi:hypothetical protein
MRSFVRRFSANRRASASFQNLLWGARVADDLNHLILSTPAVSFYAVDVGTA